MNKLLFLCTGNYYRSRFAEEYFNHHSAILKLNWTADSKGLSQNMPSLNNPGSISVHTIEALDKLGIPGTNLQRSPRPLTKKDFIQYDRIIALSEAEHRPMLETRFSAYCSNVQYFEVGDLPVENPSEALPKIAGLVDDLMATLLAVSPKPVTTG